MAQSHSFDEIWAILIAMSAAIKTVLGYQWIVVDPELLGGQPTVKGTRLSVSHIQDFLWSLFPMIPMIMTSIF
jgi:hypothetical protein